MSALASPLPYQCFISYTRIDNDDFDGVVDRLKRELAGRFEAATGSRLEIFLDRESIGWGERWRDKIAEAVAGSMLFIPIVTMRYFNSSACREEFSAFHAAATRRGATDLILPVILAGSSQITSDHPDELVQAIAELNWQQIHGDFEAGYQSSEWKRRIGALVTGLQQALERAAPSLSGQAVEPPQSTVEGTVNIEQIDEQIMQSHLAELLDGLNDLGPVIQQVGNAVQERIDGRDLSQMTPGQRTFLLGALSEDLRQPAAEFGEKSSALESATRQFDAELRALMAEMYDIDPDQTRRQIANLQQVAQSNSATYQEFLEQMSQLEKGMRMAALGSVKLRTSLRPMTDGLRSLDTIIKIIRSWESIDPSGN